MSRSMLTQAALSAATDTLEAEAPMAAEAVARRAKVRKKAPGGGGPSAKLASKARPKPATAADAPRRFTKAKNGATSNVAARAGGSHDHQDDHEDGGDDPDHGDALAEDAANSEDLGAAMDTEALAELAQACRARDESERDLEAAVGALLRQRESASQRLGGQPWTKVQELAETAFTATNELAAARLQVRETQEAMVNLRADADRWHAEADALRARMAVGATQSDEAADALAQIAGRLDTKEKECEQLREQRTRLGADLEDALKEAHETRATCTEATREAETARRELDHIKRAAQQRITRLEAQARSSREEAEKLRESEAKMRGQAEKFQAALEEARAEARSLERRSDGLQDDLDRSSRALEAIRAESARRQALLEQEQLKAQQSALEVANLSKKVSQLAEALEKARRATAVQEQARAEAFREHEEVVEDLRRKAEDMVEREGALRQSLADARAETDAVRSDAALSDADAQTRIQDLEQTLSKLLANMQSHTRPAGASVARQPAKIPRGAGSSVGKTPSGQEGDAIIAERAMRIRQEIHAATKHLFENPVRRGDTDSSLGAMSGSTAASESYPESELVSGPSGQRRDEDAAQPRESGKRARVRGRPRRLVGRASGSPYKVPG